jgi:hypothetical protein
MSNLSNRSFCHYCLHEFGEGEGRYRLFQHEELIDCCPSCFDQTRGPSLNLLKEHDTKRSTYKVKNEF